MYELSTIFLNFHWFMVRNRTRSTAEAIGTHQCDIGCRINWVGLAPRFNWWTVWYSYWHFSLPVSFLVLTCHTECGVSYTTRRFCLWETLLTCIVFFIADIYAVKEDVLLRCKCLSSRMFDCWLIDMITVDWIVYGVANFVTTCLNVWWFSQMIAMLRKRFPVKEVAKHK